MTRQSTPLLPGPLTVRLEPTNAQNDHNPPTNPGNCPMGRFRGRNYPRVKGASGTKSGKKPHSPDNERGLIAPSTWILRASTLCQRNGSAASVSMPGNTCVHKAKNSENISNPAAEKPNQNAPNRPAWCNIQKAASMPASI